MRSSYTLTFILWFAVVAQLLSHVLMMSQLMMMPVTAATADTTGTTDTPPTDTTISTSTSTSTTTDTHTTGELQDGNAADVPPSSRAMSPNTKQTIHEQIYYSVDEDELLMRIAWEDLDLESLGDVDFAEQLEVYYGSLHNQKPRLVYRTQLQDAPYFHVAALRGFAKLGRRLLELGANMNQNNVEVFGIFEMEYTHAICLAAMFNHKDFIALLIEYGQDLSVECQGLTAAHFVMDTGAHDTFEELLAMGNPVSDGMYLTSAFRGDVKSFEILESYGVSPMKIKGHGGRGDGPLAAAAMEGHFDAVKWLVERGCDVNDTSMDRGTPLSRAQEGLAGGEGDQRPWGTQHEDIITYLRSKDAATYDEAPDYFLLRIEEIHRRDRIKHGEDPDASGNVMSVTTEGEVIHHAGVGDGDDVSDDDDDDDGDGDGDGDNVHGDDGANGGTDELQDAYNGTPPKERYPVVDDGSVEFDVDGDGDVMSTSTHDM